MVSVTRSQEINTITNTLRHSTFSFIFAMIYINEFQDRNLKRQHTVAWLGDSVPSLIAKNLPKIGEKRGKIREKKEKSGRKGKHREGSSLCPSWQTGLAMLLAACTHGIIIFYLTTTLDESALTYVSILEKLSINTMKMYFVSSGIHSLKIFERPDQFTH